MRPIPFDSLSLSELSYYIDHITICGYSNCLNPMGSHVLKTFFWIYDSFASSLVFHGAGSF